MKFIFLLIFFLLSSNLNAIEPSSGIQCRNLNTDNYVEFLFKKNTKKIFAKAYKRIDGEFKVVGNVVGKKLSSFILFEDKSILPNLDFAWHLDEVTKNLKPFLLSETDKSNIKLPNDLSCISKNFWY